MKIIGLYAEIMANQIRRVLQDKGHVFFDGGRSFNINIIGIRSEEARSNKFDDALIVVQRNRAKQWEIHSYRITTDPGTFYLQNPLKVTGTAILVPGQYRGVYQLGKHKGYDAVVQHAGEVKVWRDNNKDKILDWGVGAEHSGYYGINIHKSRAGGESSLIDRWSAGCQVFKNSGEFSEFLDLCAVSAKSYGNSFTYTLLEQSDFS